MFDSVLPQGIDWTEINDFFESNSFRREILSEEWRNHKAFQKALLTDKSMTVVECLHKDLFQCYCTTFAKDENGREDRPKEYKLLREWLFDKYSNISETVLSEIYWGYLYLDR